ncbi:hypothetical protein BDU57DRAFT_560744 [Ampelomyces quisqualis]|uniref:Uncharacterized protein n=1 Tax=Ampelomyces quisqualis TaxID=50730 RepID=A0A6A5Q5M0_AMPQU|nr:hypothetical protein BDU57DRAFT_560744 [Ampelomyces quisqualis]
MFKAILVSVSAAVSIIVLLIVCFGPTIVGFVLSSMPPPAVAKEVTIYVESYPTPPPVACPEKGSPCRTPTLFARIDVTMRICLSEDKSFVRDVKDYKQPAWVEVRNNLVRAGEYNKNLRFQVTQASSAVEERDKTFRRKWSKMVGPDVASHHPPANKTNSMIMCDYLDAAVETQGHFLSHPAMAGIGRSLSQQLNSTIKTWADVDDTWPVSKSGYIFSSNARMRSVTEKLEGAFDDRIGQDDSHIEDFQEYLKLEKQALKEFERRRDTLCTVALREARGETEELQHYKLGPRVVTIPDMIWYFGGLVRKAATHVSASAH